MISVPYEKTIVCWGYDPPKVRFNPKNLNHIEMNTFLKKYSFTLKIGITDGINKDFYETSDFWDIDPYANGGHPARFTRFGLEDNYELELSFEDPKIETYFKMAFM